MNEYYTPVNIPREFSRARAGQLGAEFKRIEQGFGALPPREQLANGTAILAVEKPSDDANHYVLETAYPDQAAAYQPGQQVQWYARKTNTGVATVSIDGKPSVELAEVNGTPLTDGSIVAGWPVWLSYDGKRFRLLNSSKRIAATVIFVETAPDRTFQVDQEITDFVLPAAVSGATPYVYAVTGLPAGLTFNATTRTVSGTPSAEGGSTVSYTVTDADSESVEQEFQILIVAVLLVLATPSDLEMVEGRSYDVALPAATGGTPSYTYEVTGLPAGLGFDTTTRSVFGIPDEIGTFEDVVYKATDSQGQSSEQTFSITVRAASPLALPPIDNLSFPLNDAVDTVTLPPATGGISPYTYAVTGLPQGLAFNTTLRRVSGTPTALGVLSVTVTVTDADGVTATRDFTISITASGYRYVAVLEDKTSITATMVTGGTSAPDESTLLTLPSWSGNRYIVIAQPAAFAPLILISLGLGNSISAFTRTVNGVTIDGDSYDLWVSNDLQGDSISGGTLTVG